MGGRYRRKRKRSEPVRPKPLSAYCPNLTAENHEIESKIASRYNCIAWAAGFANKKWGHQPGYFAPDGVTRSPGIEFLISLFALLGFEECDADETGEHEPGIEKVALYADEDGWQHAARQKANGKWTSKIGAYEDIQHNSPDDVAGGDYGAVVAFMKRRFEPKRKPSRRKAR